MSELGDKKVRVQFDLSIEGVAELEHLMTETGVQTRKDLINNALTLFKWAVNESRAGNKIAAIDDESKSFRELAMPALDRGLMIR